MKSRILWSLAGTVALLATSTVAQAASIVEFYLEPVQQGSTSYSSTFTASGADAITTNAVSTTATSGTIYFDVYAGFLGTTTNAAQDGLNETWLGFQSSGTIGSAAHVAVSYRQLRVQRACSSDHRHLPGYQP